MRVLFYTEPGGLGGAERALADTARAVRPHGVQVAVLTSPEPTFERWMSHYIPDVPLRHAHVRRIPDSRLLAAGRLVRGLLGGTAPPPPGDGSAAASSSERPTRSTAAALARYGQAVTNFVRLYRLFRGAQPDVLHINNGSYPGGESCRVAALAARAAGVERRVFFVHAYAAPPEWPSPVERALDAAIDRAVDVWATAAEGSGRELSRQRGVDLERIATVYLGQPLQGPPSDTARREARERLGIPESTYVISVLANLEVYKGHHNAVDAGRLLRERGRDFVLLFAGNGTQSEVLEESVTEAALNGHVRFLGWVDDVTEVLDSSDVLMHPSTGTELLPYSIKEAMSRSLPVIATSVGGVPELVSDRETGWLVAPDDPAALAAAVEDAIAHPQRAFGYGQAGRRRIETDFTLEEMGERLMRLYTGE